MAVPPPLSVCAVADIIGKPEILTRVKECLTEETNVDTMMVEKMLQFKLQILPFIWAVMPPGREARNQAMLVRTSLTPVIKVVSF